MLLLEDYQPVNRWEIRAIEAVREEDSEESTPEASESEEPGAQEELPW